MGLVLKNEEIIFFDTSPFILEVTHFTFDYQSIQEVRLVTKFNLVMPAEKLCFVMFKIRQAELVTHSLPS